MPPLLPEYLSQPVQIVIQSPSTEWGPVLIGAAATLIGAAVGAGLGAFFSYRAALRASQRAFALDKAEALYSLAESCKSDLRKWHHYYSKIPSSVMFQEQQEKNNLYSETVERFDKLYEQLHIYANDNNIDRNYLLKSHSIWRNLLYKELHRHEHMGMPGLLMPSPGISNGMTYSAARKEYAQILAKTCDELGRKVREITGR
ncbi:hypothetical protein ACT3OH_16000 [Vreelandella zhanjiangensis]|uniref:hypothetical protein n=1 Tax=Vreelandella zhanjiangensis TaxID=1121960 RepID=UPI00402AD6AF